MLYPRTLLLTVVASTAFVTTQVHAADYGVFGALWPVEEPSILETIYVRLSEMEGNGELAQMEEEMKATARARIHRPHPVLGLGTTEVYNSYEVDLSITLDRDLADHRGVVFARAGTRINPLDHSRFNRRLIFINGDDPDQVQFAVEAAAAEPVKIILVNGAPLDLTEANQVLFYFDQGGMLTERFGLTVVPAVVSRMDPVMLVEEIPVPIRQVEAQ
ncbi:type-F conjugative transfer system protein TraW [Yoonia sp. SS1-5]|uniref:Type-F conjugative transfer system protein TraW n=1 Tax=Yoonia rhodophyticola TaxID=3137370 RepID=A0AAN0NKS2_9RHOB